MAYSVDDLVPLVQRGVDAQSSWELVRLHDATSEPITVDEAKAHIRGYTDLDAEDDYLETLIATARQMVEDYCGRALIDQTWQLRFAGYHRNAIALRRSPVIAVQSFVYDLAGVETEIDAANYRLDGARARWPRLIPSYGGVWPGAKFEPAAVIQYRAGFADTTGSPTEGAEKVPAVFKHAIKLTLAMLYADRGDDRPLARRVRGVDEVVPLDLPTTAQALLKPYRVDLGLV